jgi:hypothetical protein
MVLMNEYSVQDLVSELSALGHRLEHRPPFVDDDSIQGSIARLAGELSSDSGAHSLPHFLSSVTHRAKGEVDFALGRRLRASLILTTYIEENLTRARLANGFVAPKVEDFGQSVAERDSRDARRRGWLDAMKSWAGHHRLGLDMTILALEAVGLFTGTPVLLPPIFVAKIALMAFDFHERMGGNWHHGNQARLRQVLFEIRKDLPSVLWTGFGLTAKTLPEPIPALYDIVDRVVFLNEALNLVNELHWRNQ